MTQRHRDRNLALELLRVTEAAALAAAPLQGRGLKEEADRGSMFTTHLHYMDKLVVGRRARGAIDIEMPVEWNLRRIAKAEGLHQHDLTVVILDRERNQEIIRQVRDVGARISLIGDGDVAGAIMAAL